MGQPFAGPPMRVKLDLCKTMSRLVQPGRPLKLLFLFFGNHAISLHPPRRRGTYASSRYVECGERWTRVGSRRLSMARTAKSRGPGVPVLTPSTKTLTRLCVTGARKPVPGEIAYNP
jgi:hypothetical protein